VAAAVRRVMDDEIIAGFFNTNKTGKTATSDTGLLSAWNTASEVVPANTGSSPYTGPNIAKLRMDKRLRFPPRWISTRPR
jgi:hypothetical protein